MFPAIDAIRQRAASVSRRIIYPNPQDGRVFEAIGIVSQQRIAHPILLGDRVRIESELRTRGLSPPDIEIVEPDALRAARYADILLDGLRAQGFQKSEALEKLKIPIEYAAAMVRAGDADGLVAGPESPVGQARLEAAVGLSPGAGPRCRCFLIAPSDDGPRNAFLIVDGISHATPRPLELAEIALQACRCSRRLFQSQPRVGFLAPSVVASLGRHNRFRSASETLEGRVNEAIDTLLVRDAALGVDRQLHTGIPANGTTDIYILADRQPGRPQLESAFEGARVVGPILTGFEAPANALGLVCSVEDVIDVTAITSLS